jgi:hypothetical protein
MVYGPVTAAPPQYALQTPRPDLKQAAGTFAASLVAPAVVAEPEPPVIDKAFHARLVEDFEAAEDASRANREKAERDIDYYDNKQLTEEEFKALRKRGQPPVTLNMIRTKIDFMLGLERTQRTKPRALPRTRMHEQDAAAVGDALKFVVEDNRYDQTRSRVWKDILTAGWGGIELSIEEAPRKVQGAPSIRILGRRCPWDRMFWDPFCSEDDFSDAQYLGMVLWMDRSEAVRLYGEAAGQVFDETIQGAAVGGTYDDKPKLTTWVQMGKRQRVRIVQMYRLSDETGEWEYWEFTKGGILKGGPSPWLDEDGRRVHAYEWTSAYVDRDNNRYGVVRDMIDPQDEINKRRSKALHHYTTRQTYGNSNALGSGDVRDLKRNLNRPDGHVQLEGLAEFGKDFGIIPTNDMAQGHSELLSHVMGVFQNMGPNAAMQGKGPQSASGRAVLANQQGGAIALGPLTDNLRDMDHRAYRKMWNAIRQFWTGETWVRVTDDEKNLRWVGLNTPQMVPVMQNVWLGGQIGQQPAIGPDGQPLMQPAIDPMTGQPILQNVISEVDVDIFIDDAPDMGTMLDEQFEKLVTLKQMDRMDEIPFAAIIEAFPGLRNKDKMLEAIRERQELNAQQAEQEAPVRQAAAQTEIENKQADTAQKLSTARKNEAQAAEAEVRASQPLMGMVPGGYPPAF